MNVLLPLREKAPSPVGVAAVLHALQVVPAGGAGEGEQGAALVPRIAGGSQADVHGDGTLTIAMGQGNGLQPDAAGVEPVVAAVGQDGVHGPAGDEGEGVT